MNHHIHRLGLLEITHYGTPEAIKKTAERLSAEQAVTLTATEKAPPRASRTPRRVDSEAMITEAHQIYAAHQGMNSTRLALEDRLMQRFGCSRSHAGELISKVRRQFGYGKAIKQY